MPKKHYRRYAIYGMLVILLGGFLYFALMADAFYSGGDDDEASTESTAITPSLPVAITEREKEAILIDRPVNGLRSVSEQVEVEGPAPHNSVVGVYLNGSLMDSTVAREGHYHFPHVLLTKPTNVLQTRFYALNGSSDSSPAIMVFYQNSTRSLAQNVSFFQNSSMNISRGNSNRKELALTFDGSSEANSAEVIMKSLHQSNIRTTVFLTYSFIERYPDVTRRIAAKHEVAILCDPDTHSTIQQKISREELRHQLQSTAELFERITGRQMSRFYRFSNHHNPEVLRWGSELGYIHVAWTTDPRTRQNMDSLDWITNPDLPEYFPALLVKDRLLSFGQNEPEQANGSIVVMHLGSSRDPDDRLDRWVPELITTFRQRGYQFVTISELMLNQQPNVDPIQTALKIR